MASGNEPSSRESQTSDDSSLSKLLSKFDPEAAQGFSTGNLLDETNSETDRDTVNRQQYITNALRSMLKYGPEAGDFK